jgi:Arc/MetJ family transcription regulator
MNHSIYLFLDEGGNFDFKPSGTRYFTLTSVAMRRPFDLYEPLNSLRYDCMEYGLPTEFFHCSEDNKHVRSKVFQLLAEHQTDFSIDALVVDKTSVSSTLQVDKHFYPEMLGRLLKEVIPREIAKGAKEVLVITDTIPIQKKRQAIEKAVKQALAEKLPADLRYRVLHHASRSHFGLQIADYCNWAIFRKWQNDDDAFFERLKPAIEVMVLQND